MAIAFNEEHGRERGEDVRGGFVPTPKEFSKNERKERKGKEKYCPNPTRYLSFTALHKLRPPLLT